MYNCAHNIIQNAFFSNLAAIGSYSGLPSITPKLIHNQPLNEGLNEGDQAARQPPVYDFPTPELCTNFKMEVCVNSI